MQRNIVNRSTVIEVQSYDYGYAICASTTETVIHARTKAVDTQVVAVRKLSKVYCKEEWAARDLPVFQATVADMLRTFNISQ